MSEKDTELRDGSASASANIPEDVIENEVQRSESESCDDVGRSDNASRTEEESTYAPKGRYDALLYRVYSDKTFSQMLQISSYAIVLITAYAYFYNLIYAYLDNVMEAIRLILVTGVPFVIVSLMRYLINAPRPYEQLEFYEKPPKSKRGQSFPSRHVFSIFVTAAALSFSNLWLGIGLAVLGVALAACRVLLGMHYIRDTVTGALIGIVSGVVGMLLTSAIF